MASVPDMQGDGEDNHMDGDKGTRRWGARARCPGKEGQGQLGLGVTGRGWSGMVRPLGRWTVPSQRGRKPGSSGRKNGGMGSKSKDKKLSGTDSEQEVSEARSPLVYCVVWRGRSCIWPSMLAGHPDPSSPMVFCKLGL